MRGAEGKVRGVGMLWSGGVEWWSGVVGRASWVLCASLGVVLCCAVLCCAVLEGLRASRMIS